MSTAHKIVGQHVWPTKKSTWLFENEKESHYSLDYRKLNQARLYKDGYVPEIFSGIDTACNAEAEVYLKQMHKGFNYNLKQIVFKEGLSIHASASADALQTYKEFLMGRHPRLKIVIVNIHSPFVVSEEDKIKAANNFKKALGFENRINVMIDNSLPDGDNNEVVFKVVEL